MGMHGPQQYAALDAFGELGRSIAQAHTGFAAGAGAALSEIVQGGVAFALQARHSSQGAAQPVLACLHSPVHRRRGAGASPALETAYPFKLEALRQGLPH
jgi:hypothetical protein